MVKERAQFLTLLPTSLFWGINIEKFGICGILVKILYEKLGIGGILVNILYEKFGIGGIFVNILYGYTRYAF